LEARLHYFTRVSWLEVNELHDVGPGGFEPRNAHKPVRLVQEVALSTGGTPHTQKAP